MGWTKRQRLAEWLQKQEPYKNLLWVESYSICPVVTSGFHCVVPSWCIGVVSCARLFFLWRLNNAPLYVHTSFYPFVCWRPLGCSSFLTIANSAVMKEIVRKRSLLKWVDLRHVFWQQPSNKCAQVCLFVCFLLYWVSATVHELLLLPHSMWDLHSQTRDQTHNPCSGFLATGPPGKSLYGVFLSKQNNFWISQQHLACLLKVKH